MEPGAQSVVLCEPFPQSRKIYVEGSRPGLRVAMREIGQHPTRDANGEILAENPPITVYDTSGPYTDPEADIHLDAGLPPQRAPWLKARGDAEVVRTTKQGGERSFPGLRQVLRCRPGGKLTQRYYAQQGIITEEMEYVALRERVREEMYPELLRRTTGAGTQPWEQITPERVRREIAQAQRLGKVVAELTEI